MKRLSMAFLVVLGSVLALTPVMSAYAVKLPAYVKFKGYALGTCGLWYGRLEEYPYTPVWAGLASGSMALNGYAEATSYEAIDDDILSIYGMAYFTAPEGDVKALGFLAVTWFENSELHQLWITIYSKPTSQGIFQPKTDKFILGIPVPPLGGTIDSFLSYSGIYTIGSNTQYLNGWAMVWATKGANPDLPLYGVEWTAVSLKFGDYIMQIMWVSEPYLTLPAATMFVRDVELL